MSCISGRRICELPSGEYAGKCILAVGHGAFNRAILTYLNGGKPADMVDLPIMENTSVIRLSI